MADSSSEHPQSGFISTLTSKPHDNKSWSEFGTERRRVLKGLSLLATGFLAACLPQKEPPPPPPDSLPTPMSSQLNAFVNTPRTFEQQMAVREKLPQDMINNAVYMNAVSPDRQKEVGSGLVLMENKKYLAVLTARHFIVPLDFQPVELMIAQYHAGRQGKSIPLYPDSHSVLTLKDNPFAIILINKNDPDEKYTNFSQILPISENSYQPGDILTSVAFPEVCLKSNDKWIVNEVQITGNKGTLDKEGDFQFDIGTGWTDWGSSGGPIKNSRDELSAMTFGGKGYQDKVYVAPVYPYLSKFFDHPDMPEPLKKALSESVR
ncbi:hypothetical protein A3D05_00170 [Candidatus Gottesmanbacteria bacterium RIFCSPHIGHO2_02_FULL_40_24]|uniref:Peptidase S1 domain-containing protein n=1 Tax=Candidatus Gottesmanbacteria bacterium RIFCSPHIGHO2_01_FULL_40_15 TaxID=1798376 RepID=A0A1F5Z6A1_9BACT|nr:MAG: hypothetical protein A2777_00175 [Candidatus Gottesmanbacteria bacterium RIFCSPHIGHO2_01_FULL_40_15]OGG17766.1 MAG: hypothetical protein A3D05_00170 [Candidatus Gottesmanbacteria bacterium RIFCSPHIGHO2_02_FULL_40_24]OGG21878.1 MAG: hypothetical protein A3B48_04100 [Candidatus Gottesmanbacteria bacterium RIFCSPLOWO2_01_FULL_40_10]OGG25510.1 MAG: hypothetical protein A3E42_03640 [Candidatus Gottesmanbacteria bacterium RIFCSPHIGHO2_12_FULL_40_13]OGG33168.1 MAG: hypothetical protein A3I80_0